MKVKDMPNEAPISKPASHPPGIRLALHTSRSALIASRESRVTDRRTRRKNHGFQSPAAVKSVPAATSVTDRPPQTPSFRAAPHQNAAVGLPLANRRCPPQPQFTPRSASSFREESASHCPSCIYGTGIKIARISFTLNEYKILIHGKPRPLTLASALSLCSASSASFPPLCANISNGEFACRT